MQSPPPPLHEVSRRSVVFDDTDKDGLKLKSPDDLGIETSAYVWRLNQRWSVERRRRQTMKLKHMGNAEREGLDAGEQETAL